MCKFTNAQCTYVQSPRKFVDTLTKDKTAIYVSLLGYGNTDETDYDLKITGEL